MQRERLCAAAHEADRAARDDNGPSTAHAAPAARSHLTGEVRGPEALALLKAWNTGHPGGIGTIHANGAEDALYRLEDFVAEATAAVPHRAIASASDSVVFIERSADTTGRKVSAIVTVSAYEHGRYVLLSVATHG